MLVNPTMSEKKIVTCKREKESVKQRALGNSSGAFEEFGRLWNSEQNSLRYRLHIELVWQNQVDTSLN